MPSSTRSAGRGRPPLLLVAAAIAALAVTAGVVTAGVLVVLGRRRRRRPVGDAELQARVVDALAVDARTWWLPQPEVTVQAGTVTLTGGSPHPDGHDAMLAVVRSVASSSAIRDALVPC